MDLFYKNNNDRIQNTLWLSFSKWAQENALVIRSALIDEGINFLTEHAERLKSRLSNLILDGRFHYLDKAKKESYLGRIEQDARGVPYLHLSYSTFRHGGLRASFDSKSFLKKMWFDYKANNHAVFKSHVAEKEILPTPTSAAPSNNQWLNADKALWENLSTEGESSYLKRKGLLDLYLPGLRYDKQFIAVQITDPAGQFYGLQKIYADGQKRFTKGLIKKGHFALIGEECIPSLVERIHICEGVATAASIYCALGEPVFSALDAYNLYPVAKNLKAHYPKKEIIIWADNDWQKAQNLKPNGEVLGNTGLIMAHSAAFKLRNARVACPDFSMLAEDIKKEASDFNDLYQQLGESAILEALPQKPDFALALWHEKQKHHKAIHGRFSPNNFKDASKHCYQERYLPELEIEEGIHLIHSAIGTGKTALVENLLKGNPKASVLFTTHLISLVESAAQRLNLSSYNNCDNFDLQFEPRLSICLNSLGKLTAEGPVPSFDIVVIDESDQVFSRFISQIEQKPLVFKVLAYLMKSAKTLICLDAHLSEITLDMVKRFCPNQKINLHLNEYKAAQEKEIILYDKAEEVQFKALETLKAGQRLYMAFNSKREAHKTYCTFKTSFPEKKGLYISSSTAGEKETEAFFKDVNQNSLNYDYIVCTPSVSTGVSIDHEHFDVVAGIFSAQVNSANDALQALGRVRKAKKFHVFCDLRKANKDLDPKVIRSKWLHTHAHDLSLMSLTESGELIMNEDYEHLSLLVTLHRHRSQNDFYGSFMLLALYEGFKLSYGKSQFSEEERLGFRHFKNACFHQEEGNLQPLERSMEALEALYQKPRKTLEENKAYNQEELKRFYGIRPEEKELLTLLEEKDQEGRLKQQILNLELALGDLDNASACFKAQYRAHPIFVADLKHFATEQMLFQKLFEVLDISNQNGQLQTSERTYTKEDLLASGFIGFIEKHRVILQGIIPLPSPELLTKDPLRFLSLLLKRLGLKQKRSGKSEKGAYLLDQNQIYFLNLLLAKRKGRAVGSSSVPLELFKPKAEKKTTFSLNTLFTKLKGFFQDFSPPIPAFS